MPTLPNASSRTSNKSRIPLLFLLLWIGLVCSLLLALAFGSADISILDALAAIKNGDLTAPEARILLYIRLPRALAATFAGAALAVSGVIIQAVLHNPMAAPNLIGVNAGAGLAAAITLTLFPTAITALPFASFFGALAACLLIYAIAVKSGGEKLTVTLVGIAVGSVLNAGINTLKYLFPDAAYDADVFMIGGFCGVTLQKLLPACLLISICLLLAFFAGREIDVLSLGDTAAKSVGMHVTLIRFLLLVLACALAGAAVSFSGLLGFVGLLVPHIMRKFVGSKHSLLLPASAWLGSILVLLCDLIARTAFAPYELPVGILLSLLGGVFFITLVLSDKKGRAI